MARVKTFIGVEITPTLRNSLVVLQRSLSKSGADVKWVEPSQFHITLNFLGEIDNRDIHPVCRAITKVAAREPEFRLSVRGVGAFPTVRRPKTLWAGIDAGADSLIRIYDALAEPLEELGVFRREDRGYTPHLTLGRVKADVEGQKVAALLPSFAEWEGGDLTVSEIILWSSDLYPEGPVYTVLGRGQLG